MEEKNSKIQSIIEYKEKLKDFRNRRAMVVAAVVILILAAALGIAGFIRYRTFSSYETISFDMEEDTLSSGYVKLGENVLRYGISGARLTDRDENELWSIAYSMDNPAAEVSGEAGAVYEQGGTSIRTFGADGQLGQVTTPYPIRKAKAAAQGVTAAILEDGDNTWLKYYSTDGTEIASFRTQIDSPGYPMDLSLSPDGMTLAVAYVYPGEGQVKSQVAFYNFGSAGKSQKDHLVKAVSYDDLLIPQLDYVDENTCVAYTEKGFLVFEGTTDPEETAKVEESQEILSICKNDSYVVMTVESSDVLQPYTLKLYSLSGKEIFQENFDFSYENMEMDEDQILLWNRGEFAIYNFSGVEKFNGSVEEGQIQEIIGVGNRNYLGVLDQGLLYMKLR